MDMQVIEVRLDRLITKASTGIPPSEVAEMIALVRAGEPGVALENFCTQLKEYEVVLPPGVADELRTLALAMGMTIPKWIDKPTPG
jgi:hypothetical protein